MARLREGQPDPAAVEVPENLVNFHLGDWGGPSEGLAVLRERWRSARAAWSQAHAVDIDEVHGIGMPVGTPWRDSV